MFIHLLGCYDARLRVVIKYVSRQLGLHYNAINDIENVVVQTVIDEQHELTELVCCWRHWRSSIVSAAFVLIFCFANFFLIKPVIWNVNCFLFVGLLLNKAIACKTTICHRIRVKMVGSWLDDNKNKHVN